ncbi:MAG: TolB family protein [Thermodesulfobacteriota bacterium]
MKSNLKIIGWTISIILLAIFLTACGKSGGSENGGGSSSPPVLNDYTAFSNPEIVTINGYNGDAMEPFISRDGKYLFFNNSGSTKDLFYAIYLDDTTFQYWDAITAINTPFVDGAPTMDETNTFYYISNANYNPPTTFDTLYMGTWNGSTVTGSTPVTGLAITTPGMVNFDIEVSPDGSTLYFNDGDFTGGNNMPDTANIVIAVNSGSGFTRDPNSATIMANVNTGNNLEYAPAISADGLELFFTRFDQNTSEVHIYRAVRADTGSPFEVPQLVSAIEGSLVEGPSLSPDEKSLYYHRRNTNTGAFEIYRVTRP